MALVERQRMRLRIQDHPAMSALTRQRDQPLEERAADSPAAPRGRYGEAADVSVGQQPSAADDVSGSVHGDGMTAIRVDAVPFDLHGDALLDDEDGVPHGPEGAFVLLPVREPA